MHSNTDVVVIGGGPSGCAAATYAARCRWKATVVDRQADGGFLGSMGNVSYFPGFPEAISGADLGWRMRRQAELVGVDFVSDTAVRVEAQGSQVAVRLESGRELSAPAAVVATGAAARTSYMQGEREFLGRGVSHDALADGPAVARRTAAVIGKTRRAAEEAIALARFAEKIHFIIPSSKLEVEETLLKQLQAQRSIELHFSTSLKNINGSDHVSSVTVFTVGQEKEIPVSGVFTYVHEYQSTTGFLEGAVEMAEHGAVKIDSKFGTSAGGVFACGDAICGRPQLPAVAAAQGLLAGISVDRYLSSRG